MKYHHKLLVGVATLFSICSASHAHAQLLSEDAISRTLALENPIPVFTLVVNNRDIDTSETLQSLPGTSGGVDGVEEGLCPLARRKDGTDNNGRNPKDCTALRGNAATAESSR